MSGFAPLRDRDLRRIYVAAFARAFAASFLGVYLGLEFARRAWSPEAAGGVLAAGMAGHTASLLVVALLGERVGRRRTLQVLSVVALLGGALAGFIADPGAFVAVAFLGLLNGMGRDRGAALALEQAAIADLVESRGRTWAMALHALVQDAGHALGALLLAVPILAASGFTTYTLALLVPLALSMTLSVRVDRAGASRPFGAAPPVVGAAAFAVASRPRIVKICLLFLIDSFAGGFLGSALLAWFFFERFGASPATVALLFAAARVLNALSHLGAAWLARRFGLLRTMVFTHLPSSLLLASVPWMPTFGIAAALFLLREGLVEMDVPTRQSYVLAIVRPEERTFTASATLLVRNLGWALGPAAAGITGAWLGLSAPLVVAATLKIGYDLLLWREFRRLQPPEELDGPASVAPPA